MAKAKVDGTESDKHKQRTHDAIVRAINIAQLIGRKDDLRVRDRIVEFQGKENYSDRESLLIAEDAWRHVVRAQIMPRLVFAHPKLLMAIPEASLHYRGLSLLSRKRVEEIVGSIERWERESGKINVEFTKALGVCRLYNAVISSIILDNTDWTIENGYRNILANMGITADGMMRNIVGQAAEKAIKDGILEWVKTRDLLSADQSLASEDGWDLHGGVLMRFGSEPDISFEKDGAYAVLVEIKGGKDPAGALERLGAIQKTFEEAPAQCKNFLVVGVITSTMQTRLNELRIERVFKMDDLLQNVASWTEFMNEIFHHALRIAPEVQG